MTGYAHSRQEAADEIGHQLAVLLAERIGSEEPEDETVARQKPAARFLRALTAELKAGLPGVRDDDGISVGLIVLE